MIAKLSLFTNLGFLYKNNGETLTEKEDVLNKARILILSKGLFSFFLIGFIILLIGIFGRHRFFFDVFILMSLFAAGLVLLITGTSWKIIGHLFIIAISYLIWSNVNFYNLYFLVAIQYLLIIVTFSYYLLEERWGNIYSFANIIPFLLIVLHYLFSDATATPKLASVTIFSIILVFNFILISAVHYDFFRAFRKSNDNKKLQVSDLKKSLAYAEEFAVAKTNFLSTMSHELRTPLNAIIGMSSFILTEPIDEKQKNNFEVVQFSAENLMSIVNDITDFEKIDTVDVKLDNHPFNVSVLLKNIYGAFKLQAERKKLAFDFSVDKVLNNLEICGDSARLSRILFNLIGNAIKFTDEGRVSLTANALAVQDGKITIHFIIEDTGIGIPADQQLYIFEPYLKRQSANSRQYHGSGLGMIIAKKLIDLHNSQLLFKSIEGKGSTFFFNLVYPFQQSKVPAVINSNIEGPPLIGQKLRVLIAEDNSLNVLVLKKILNKWNIEPVVAENGLKALECVEQGDFDIILMDINMPVMDGFEASTRIRALPDAKKSGVFIVAITASSSAAIEQNTGYKYLDAFIQKPFKPEQLKEIFYKLAPGYLSN